MSWLSLFLSNTLVTFCIPSLTRSRNDVGGTSITLCHRWLLFLLFRNKIMSVIFLPSRWLFGWRLPICSLSTDTTNYTPAAILLYTIFTLAAEGKHDVTFDKERRFFPRQLFTRATGSVLARTLEMSWRQRAYWFRHNLKLVLKILSWSFILSFHI